MKEGKEGKEGKKFNSNFNSHFKKTKQNQVSF